ncbi:GntR family transcriptional regulator [Streptomyces sp. NBC_01275]|nr:GntR family transcriptional regulator [Streptomyces sp. NBC_01275]
MLRGDSAETELRARIEDGTYEVDDKLPSVACLGEELGVSREVTDRAVNRLAAAGILLRVPSRGIVVTDPRTPRTGTSLRVRTGPGKWETWTVPPPGTTNADHLRAVVTSRVADGAYAPGRRIPRLAQLADEFGVGVPAASRALKPLGERGLLIHVQGQRGLFVHPDAQRRLRAAAGSPAYSRSSPLVPGGSDDVRPPGRQSSRSGARRRHRIQCGEEQL